MSVLNEVLDANKKYVEGFGEKGKLALPPARQFAILTCMDARLDPAKYAGLTEGDAHVIRNAGARASDDAIRSLIISYKLLGTKAHAIGGMSAFIPNRRDKEVTDRALEAVKNDKAREAADGFDGTWVAHPDLIPIAQAEFDAVLGTKPNQVDRLRNDVHVTPDQLLDIQSIGGDVTDAGLRTNVAVGLRYIESWLRGTGAAAIDNLMEDVATAEISRSQIWQWIRYEVVTRVGRHITHSLVEQIIFDILQGIERNSDDRFDDAVTIFRQICLDEDHFPTFLTLSAYSQFLVSPAASK